jgi:transcriptional regulator with XRE-family HTH domain
MTKKKPKRKVGQKRKAEEIHVGPDDFGPRLRAERLRKKWTQEVAAERCGVSASYLADIERGRVVPTVPTIAKILGGMGLDCRKFFPK